jgi:NADH dehydrogenase
MRKIIIVGGGFAGLHLAKKLAGVPDFDVVLVDRNNYHFFPPLLYQVSTAFIEPSNISYPLRRLFQSRKNIRFFMGDLRRVIPETNTIETDHGNLAYDYLVLAMGTETNFFGNKNLEQHALPMKTIDDALTIRNHILLCLEESARSTSPTEKGKLGNIVIAGAGPTGIEMAGMLAEMSRTIVAKDYPEGIKGAGRIYLIDGGPTVLSTMSGKAQQEADHVLSKLGVRIILNTFVKDYNDEKVLLSTGESVTAATLIWASGVVARAVPGLPADAIAPGRRIAVNEINQVRNYENIFSIGDQCFQTADKKYPKGHPQVAQVAIQQGTLLAKNLIRLLNQKPTQAFVYADRGSMAIISKFKAVVDLPGFFFRGFFAWMVWLFIHIMPLVGLPNKIKLSFNWLWSFITNDPVLRLIIRPDKKK